MMTKEITNIDLFIPVLDFECCGENIDLYNYYTLKSINKINNKLILQFALKNKYKDYLFSIVQIIFENYSIKYLKYNLDDINRSITLGNLQRCKFEIDGKLFEYAQDGSRYFLIEFLEGQTIELFSSKVQVKFII